ncbi:hypothetical protein BGZ73_003566 [Actinomortierella ambigua]|nr:hypothetical protein BGZ73_003566 [Actinomortierella ambigua]
MLLAPTTAVVNGTPRAHQGVNPPHAAHIFIVSDNTPSFTNSAIEDPIAEYESILARRHSSADEIAASLHRLRQLVLCYGVPTDDTTPVGVCTTPLPGKSSVRARIWKLLLEVHHVSAQEYISLVKMGKPEANGTYNKIRNDTFRTMATDKRFLDVVDEDRLIRVLCAFAWKMHAPEQEGVSFTYVQGMNVLAAPFLYAMSEMDAFYSFSNFIQFCCPLYVQPLLQGVHCGIKLLEACLREIDLELYESLRAKRLSAELYAFPSVLTLCACTPPLDEAMQLWDFLLAWGVHLNILCIIAQMTLIRQELLEHASPMKILRVFPNLDAAKIIAKTMEIIRLIPDPLYDMLVRHPYDPSVAEQVEAYGHDVEA